MRAFKSIGRGLSITAAGALLSACAGSSPPISASNTTTSGSRLNNNKTFFYTGKEQTFVVPTGVTQLTVVAHGGEGGSTYIYPSGDPPGFPARVYAVIPVNPGDKLYVDVGGSGAHGG